MNVKVEAKCKVCQRPLVLSVDPDYAACGDVFKLVRLATCNPCYDLHVKRQSIEDQVKALCMQVITAGGTAARLQAAEKVRDSLRRVLKKYLDLICEVEKNTVAWEEGMLEDILEKPRLFPDFLKGMWALARERTLL